MWQHVIWFTGTHFKWTSCLHFQIPFSSTLKTEAGGSSETMVPICQTTQCHSPGASYLHTGHCKNLKSHMVRKFSINLQFLHSLVKVSHLLHGLQFTHPMQTVLWIFSVQCNTILAHFLTSWTLPMLIILANSWCYKIWCHIWQ